MRTQSTFKLSKYLISLYKKAILLTKTSSSFKPHANDVQTHLPVDILALIRLKQLRVRYISTHNCLNHLCAFFIEVHSYRGLNK